MLRWLFWLVFSPLWLPVRLVAVLLDKLRPVTALQFRLSGPLPDVSAGSGPLARASHTLLTLLLALEQAEHDSRLRRVVVRIDGFAGGLGRAEELRDALMRVQRSGKEVVVLADTLDLAGFWIGLGASRILLSPTGSLEVSGVASHFTLFKGLLDKVGLRARLLAKGRYKSMREVFAEDQMSDSNREMLESIVFDLYGQLEERIVSGRNYHKADVRAAIDQGPFRAAEAKSLGLIDELTYAKDFLDNLKEDKTHRALGPKRYLKRRQRRFTPRRLTRVALLEVEGSIKMGKDQYGPYGKQSTGARSFIDSANRLEQAKHIKGILLRVNSPGGSALASDLMWHALGKARKDRPLWVSMGNVAASGGYYVSGVQGAKIVASCATLTGSIGVVGGKVEAIKLYDKLGLGHEVISVGKNATFHSPTSEWSEEQLEKMQRDIDALYGDFVRKMAEGRGRPVEAIEQVAQGRVWTGALARSNGLVDELGGLRLTIESLRQELGLAPLSPLEFVFAERPSAMTILRMRLDPSSWLGEALAAIEPVLRVLPLWGSASSLAPDEQRPFTGERLWCRLPFDFRWF